MKACQCTDCYKPIVPDKGYKKIEDKYFCDIDCLNSHLQIEERLREAADPFIQNEHVSKKWWGARQPLVSSGFTEEAEKM